MPQTAKVPKAIVIDDAYALPTAHTLTNHLRPLRRFLNRRPEAKAWFDAEFGLSGSAMGRSYFDALVNDEKKLKAFWSSRESCPDPDYLTQAIGDLVAEVLPKKAPLEAIENELAAKGFEVKPFSRLPAVGTIDLEVSLVVIDYVLQEEVPADIDARINESITFIKDLIAAIGSTGCCPLVILVSSLPVLGRNAVHSQNFKANASIQGGFFRFVSKAHIVDLLGGVVDGFSRERDELNAFRNFLEHFVSAYETEASALKQQIKALELHDLATLQVGQLAVEGESLGDYLSWICGQALTNKLLSDPPVAHYSDLLPKSSYKVLLGNLEPSQGIPNLFHAVSSVKTASGELAMQRDKKRQLRFGDVFAHVRPKAPKGAPPTYFLLISQTCDLLHCNLENGHVLCIEGAVDEFAPTEIALLEATMKQMNDQGQVVKMDNKYLQIVWQSKNLITLEIAALAKERSGFKYLGRLNEIYALEAQRDALNELSRVGVPIKPAYSTFFGEARIRVYDKGREVTAFHANLKDDTIIAALRCDRVNAKTKAHLLLSEGLRNWLRGTLGRFSVDETFPGALKELSDELMADTNNVDFRIICTGTTGVIASREVIDDKGKPKPKKIDKFELLLPDLPLFGSPAAQNGVRISLELIRISE